MAAAQGRGRQRRAAILEATVALMFDAGIAAVTHRQVAEAARVPLGSIRYYFSTREDLLLAAADALEQARSAAAERAVLQATTRVGAAADLFVLAFYGPDLSDACLKGYVGIVVDCARDSERLSLRMREYREASDRQLRRLLDGCGHQEVAVSLATAVVDGSLLNAAALRLDGLADRAAGELAPVLTAAARGA